MLMVIRLLQAFPNVISQMQCAAVDNITTPQPFYGPFSGTTRVSRC